MTSLIKPINRRRFMQTTAAVGAAVTLPLGSTAKAARKKGGKLRVGVGHGSTTDSLDPGLAENGFVIPMLFSMHSYVTEVGTDGSVQPGVAESWEASADAATWTFTLRKGVTFHNGKSVTPEDVIVSINHHRGDDSTSAAKPLVASITDIRAEGSDKVVISLESGNADFPYTMTDYHMPVMPAKDGKADWASAIGCGPYVMGRFQPGIGAEMDRNPNYWRSDSAFFDAIEIIALVEFNARTTALISGEVDVIDKLDLKTVGLMARNQSLNIHSVAGTQHYTFAMSTDKAPYDDNNIRMALKHGINRQELVDKILFGYGSVGNDHPIGQGQRYFNKDLAQTTYDPDKSKWHLKQAGLDSISVELSAADAAFGGAVDAAVLFQNSAREGGIDLTPVREPNDGYWADVWMKKPFSAVYWGGRPVEDQMFSTAYQCGAAWNDSFWCNDRFEKLLVEGRAELEDSKRQAIYYEMQEIVSRQGGVIIPMFANYVFATSDKVLTSETMASNWDMDGHRWADRWSFA